MTTKSKRAGIADAAARKTFWALCDQGVISAGNFCTNLVLIRHLPAIEFGVFALLLNALLFLNNLHASTVTYIICVKGAQADESALGKVATAGLAGTAGISLLNVVTLYFACRYVAHRELLLVVVLAGLCWQLQESLRTVFLSRLRYDRAIPGDTVSYLGQAVLVGIVCLHGNARLSSIFLIVMATSLTGAMLQVIQIRPSSVSWAWLSSFGRDIWVLGRWSSLAKLVAFFSLQAFPWVLAYRYGLIAVAGFQALFQLVALTNPVLLSTNNLIMASIAKGHRRNDPIVASFKYILYSGAVVSAYFVILLLSGGRVMSLFYGRNSGYIVEAPLLRAFVVAYALEFVAMFAGAILAGMENTRALLIQQLWGMAIAVFLVLPFVFRSGLRAAAYGLIVVNAAKAVSGWYMVHVGRLTAPPPVEADVAVASV